MGLFVLRFIRGFHRLIFGRMVFGRMGFCRMGFGRMGCNLHPTPKMFKSILQPFPVEVLLRRQKPNNPKHNRSKPLSVKNAKVDCRFTTFCSVGVRLRRHRCVFASHRDLIRTIEKTIKFQPEMELSPNL